MFHRHQRYKKHNKKFYDVTSKSISRFSFKLMSNQKITIRFCINFENISLSIQRLCDFNKQFVNFRLMITSKVFDTLFNCIRFDILLREIDCWKSIKISTLVCVTSIMKTRKLIFFFELHHRQRCWIIRVFLSMLERV